MLTIRLLGPPSVLLNDRPLLLKRRKSRALLYYLAAHPQPVTRRQVALLLWGDHNDDTARHNLRTTLYSLRQEVGDYLRTEEEWISLEGGPEDLEVDTRTFAAALEHPKDNNLEAILTLYRGDFLADFDMPDSEEYENWIAVASANISVGWQFGVTSLPADATKTPEITAALAPLCSALALDPFQEDLQREGMRLHYFAGDRAGAIRRYEEFSKLLESEMGVQPMAETRALHHAIMTDQVVAAIATPPTQQRVAAAPVALPAARLLQPTAPSGPPFTGRGDELHRLAELRPAHQLILVQGETGMGKTRLVETYLTHLQSGAGDAPVPLVLVGRARQLESRLPYQPLIEAMRTFASTPTWATLRLRINLPVLWWQEIARLLPEVMEPAATPTGLRTPDESRLWEGVFQLLAALAQQQPLILFIDDLHWADAATLGLLGYLVRQSALAKLPVTFLTTSTPPPPGSELAVLLQALLREDRLAQVQLERLDADAVMALARWLSPTYGYPLGSWLYRSSEGIPLVLAELVRYLRDEHILSEDGSVNLQLLPSTPVVPPTIYTLIQSRLMTLSEAARRVLDAAVAIGREFEFEIVARAAALSDTAALDALDEVRQARLIHVVDERHFAFEHSLIMEVAYQEVGELRHRLLHRRVAAALESVHQDRLDEVAGLIAQHYAEGNEPALAAKYARVAGRRAVRMAAWKAATGFFRQALAGGPDADKAELLVALGNAQLLAGESGAAEETLREALQLPATQRQLETLLAVLRGLGQSLIMQARYAAVMELAQSYAGHADPAIRGAAQFMWGVSLSLEGLDLDEAARHLAESKAEVQPGGLSDAQVAQADFELGNIAARQGRLQEAIAFYEHTLELTRPNQEHENRAQEYKQQENDESLSSHILAHNNLAYHLNLMGDPRAQVYLETAIAMARDKGMLPVVAYLLSTKGEIALAQEDFAGAESAFHQALAHAQRLNQPERVAGVTANLGLLALARGQRELAVHHFAGALRQADAISSRFLAAQIRLWLAPLVAPAEARSYLAEARSSIITARYHRLLPELERLEASLASV